MRRLKIQINIRKDEEEEEDDGGGGGEGRKKELVENAFAKFGQRHAVIIASLSANRFPN